MASPILLVAAMILGQDNFPEIPTFKATPAAVEEVARLYLDAGLPVPPKDAQLAVIASSVRSDPPSEDWGYVMSTQKTSNKVEVQFGTHVREIDRADVTPIDPATARASSLRLYSWGGVAFSEPSGLALVACEATRGHSDLALAVLKRAASHSAFGDYRLQMERRQPASDDTLLRERLGSLAVLHWVNEWLTPGSNRDRAAKGVARALAVFPEVATAWAKGVAGSMALTVSTPKAPAGTDEGLVDMLLDSTQDGERMSSPDPSEEHGFDALRALDQR